MFEKQIKEHELLCCPGVQALFYFVLGHTQLASAFMMGTYFEKSRSATGFAYIWIVGNGLVANFLYLSQANKPNHLIAIIMEFSPPIAVFRGLWEFSAYALLGVRTHSHGMTWMNLHDDDNAMIRLWIICLVEWPIFMWIAWIRSGVSCPF